MKIKTSYLLPILCLFTSMISAQKSYEISQDWASFMQRIEVNTTKPVRFKVSMDAKVSQVDTIASSRLWVRVDTKPGTEDGFFSNMGDNPITENSWKRYTIEGSFGENAKMLNFGAYADQNGDFWFDNFEVELEQKDGTFKKLEIDNPGLEVFDEHGYPRGWRAGIGGKIERVMEFDFSSSNDRNEGKSALKVSSRNAKQDRTYLVGRKNEEFTPQIATLVSMLENMTTRVENHVRGMSQEETDWLFDEDANSFGALVMHLAAAEVVYQLITFENRSFNKEETEKWGVALDLGDEAKEKFKGKDIKEYLDIWKEVRQKTLEEFKKRDDDWLQTTYAGGTRNMHYAWFHVIEHQSSHLGQMRFLGKRMPDFSNKLPEKIRD